MSAGAGTGETHQPPAADAAVVLDIGGNIGALVFYAPGSMAGTEVAIFRSDDAHEHTHALVCRRIAGGVESFAAVYPALPAGEYRIAGVDAMVVVEGGAVTEASYGTPAYGTPAAG